MKFRATTIAAAAALMPAIGQAAPVYLNSENMLVSLGSSMAAEPFANRSTAASLASVIDAPAATSFEKHNQSTHVWVSGGKLELVFDLKVEYDLKTFHFWNYHSEGFDVDDIDLSFYDGSNALVGTLFNVAPALGGASPSDAAEIFAENSALAFPTKVRYVNAVLSGSNGQVDFNNIGFTGELTIPTTPVPEPGTYALMLAGLAGIAAIARRRRLPRAV